MHNINKETHSERELELLAVIEQMREGLDDASKYLSYYYDEQTRSHVNEKVRKALALTPESALKEDRAKVLEEAADEFDGITNNWLSKISPQRAISDELRRMAEERRKP